jgi:hypothetical protein
MKTRTAQSAHLFSDNFSNNKISKIAPERNLSNAKAVSKVSKLATHISLSISSLAIGTFFF